MQKYSLEKIEDSRGYFARTFDKREFQKLGLIDEFIQLSISSNKKKGTFRGMHFQTEPHSETKIVSCVKGKIFDVIVDLRKESPTFRQWESNELSSDDHTMLYIPEGIAHGFQTMDDDSEVSYHMSKEFNAKYYTGVRWDDPAFRIELPLPVTVISEKDSSYERFEE